MAVGDETDLVIITGLSGAGKSTAVRCFEQMGYFTVDNMPPALLPTFVGLCQQQASPVEHIAAVVDVRGGEFFADARAALDSLADLGVPHRVLFLDALTDSLVSRFKEHRVPHPLHARCDSLLEAIEAERRLLQELKERASVVLDTSEEPVQQLRDEIVRLFSVETGPKRSTVQLVTFGYKYGIPPDVDYIFDVRFLRNPHHDLELRPHTGEDPRVRAYIEVDPRAQELVGRLAGLLDYVLPEHWTEGRRYVSIGIGCTGGKHRSVYVAIELARHCEELGHRVVLQHRDLGRE
jgi:UPF0042 nucleotide-binding protein